MFIRDIQIDISQMYNNICEYVSILLKILYFCCMKGLRFICLIAAMCCFVHFIDIQAQTIPPAPLTVTQTLYEGDSIPRVDFYTLYVYPKPVFKTKRQERAYYKLIRDVKKALPIAKEVNGIIIETYEYLMTLPKGKAREEHLKRVEKGLKQQYTPRLKKLTFAQGKLLIKLVDRECNQTGYDLVKAFMGPLRAGFYQTFAAMFGASLKKTYDPEGEDAPIERIIRMVESGQL